MFHVEPGEVVSGPSCPCCSRTGRSAFGFVQRGTDSVAFYYAWLDPHEDTRAVSLAISLGDWSQAGDPGERKAAAIRFTGGGGEVEGSFVDPVQSPFHDRDVLGPFLSESEVRSGPLLARFLEVAEAIVLDDPEVNSHLTA
jgi:hypothetical protein